MKKPKIRFKGYTDVWEQRKLGEVLERRNEQRQQNEDYPRLAFASGQGVIPLSERKTNNREQLTKDEFSKKYLVTELDDIVYNPANVKYGAIDRNKCGRGLISPIYVTFTTNEIPGFIERIVTSHNFQQRALRFEEGTVTKRQSVNPEDLVTLDIIVAPKREEQQKISEYFDKLDHLITLHQRKYDFEVKFSTYVWEQRKLEEVINVCSGRDYKHLENGDIPVYGTGGYMLSVSEALSENQDAIGIGRKGTIDKPFVLKSPFWTVDTLFYCIPKTNCYLSFSFCIFQNINWKAMDESTGVPSLSKTAINKVEISSPNFYEQVKIGQYFDKIDHLITLHQRKYDFEVKFSTYVWEQRKFGDLGSVSMCKRIFKEQTSPEGDIPFYKIGTFGSSPDAFISRELFEEYREKFQYPKVGDMLISASGTIGRTVEYKGEEAYFQDSNIVWFKHNDQVHNSFLKCVYAFVKWSGIEGSTIKRLYNDNFLKTEFSMPGISEQKQIGIYFQQLDSLITLHQCKCMTRRIILVFAWEQRKLSNICSMHARIGWQNLRTSEFLDSGDYYLVTGTDFEDGRVNWGTCHYVEQERYEQDRKIQIKNGSILITKDGTLGKVAFVEGLCKPATLNAGVFNVEIVDMEVDNKYLFQYLKAPFLMDYIDKKATGGTIKHLNQNILVDFPVWISNYEEQKLIGAYFQKIDYIITLHHREYFHLKLTLNYTISNIYITKETIKMSELEAIIESKLIDQLVYGDSQWTYRKDLKTESDLWANFRYILEQNNKDRLNGDKLSDAEFEQVKNQLQFPSFYKAGEWLVGENGKVQVHVQRDTERLHLVVMNHEHIAGGSSVYEVINQYNTLKADENRSVVNRDRRFDVTLLINGLPMIHIELKNKQYSYMDGFWQIKKYIGEGKLTGIFSAVQMFVISNGVNTKYFSAASDTELNPKFISGWLDKDNNPVSDYLEFAKNVLRIPEAHEMIARYTVLDEDAKRLILLRPYQIHAIESIREASKQGKSGFVWHTTGSGKTLTSYKATRNLLMDIPAIDKTIFLIDRKDLDTQTTMAFQTYANNDIIDVDETENVIDLKKKLKLDDRQVIVTTIQKLYRLITKRLKEGTPEYNKIKNLKLAFVVDECHRAVTPSTKRELERFFGNSLWYGFTGTPRFAENPYPQLGDLPRTTEKLYGERLHRYTIQNAIHDNAVLGFQVEHNGPKTIEDETDSSAYDNEMHMLKVLEMILNKSYHKLGFQNGKGKTYEALLTTSSIQIAQKYYDLLTRVKNGDTSLVIDEKVKQVLPDFPKFAITYSVTENEEGSQINQQKMQESLDDYNRMFGTKFELAQIRSYNGNLNKRLARKDAKYKSRNEQLDLVIVVDRLLTGFDAPCMSTIFIDRQPMGPHDLIQAFSRTNRIFDKFKTYGQIVTFQAPKLFKKCVDNAVKLYSAGGTKEALLAEWDEIESAFRKALSALRVSASTPEEIPAMSKKEKEVFAKMFQNFDKLFAQLKSFTNYEDSMPQEYGITEEEYDNYAGHYLNVIEELRPEKPESEEDIPLDVDPDYELMAYSNTKIDYEYIINLIQNIVTPTDDFENISPEERSKKIEEVKQYVEELRKENPKVAEIMSNLINEIEIDEDKYKGQSILNIVEKMKYDCIDKIVTDFCIIWYVSKDDVMYAATHYRNDEIPNKSAITATIDYASYRKSQEKALPKFRYYTQLMRELNQVLKNEIKPLLKH